MACRSVLVIGAGHDPYRHLFLEPARYLRLDIERLPGITDVCADAQQLPFRDGEFDCVLAVEVMEHLRDPMRFSLEVQRVLCDGGQAVISVPFLFHYHADPADYWRPTRQALGHLFASAVERQIIAQGHRVHVLSDLITTAFAPRVWLFPLRIVNHALARLPGSLTSPVRTSAPSGFLLIARMPRSPVA